MSGNILKKGDRIRGFTLIEILLALFILVSLSMGSTHSNAGELGDCQVPPAVDSNGISPNVMVVLDSSGTMRDLWIEAHEAINVILDAYPEFVEFNEVWNRERKWWKSPEALWNPCE